MGNEIYNYIFSYDFEGLSSNNYTTFKINFFKALVDKEYIFDINYQVGSTITFKSNLESDKIEKILLRANSIFSQKSVFVRYFLAVINLNSVRSNPNNESIENFDDIIQ